MGSSPIPSAFNLRPPSFADEIVKEDRTGSDLFLKYLTNLSLVLQSMSLVNVQQFGARGNGVDDSTSFIQQAINTVLGNGGGIVYFPAGDFRANRLTVPPGSAPITFMGQGPATKVRRLGEVQSGHGMFDIYGSNVSFTDIVLDGDRTTPVGLQYNTDFATALSLNDPMAPSLSNNSTVWLHGGTSNFSAFRTIFTHAAGYSLLIDAMDGDINGVEVFSSRFVNNRPTLFGVAGGPLIYGSWNGGLYINGDGRTLTAGVVNDVLVSQCRFLRNTGNCGWSHVYGFVRLHSAFRFIANYFLDIGLDGIEPGGVSLGCAEGNIFRRIGYTTLADDDRSIPRWLAGLNATALDSSGLVTNFPYTGNSFLNVNGGNIDADGHGQSVLGGNVCRISLPGESEYDEDQIAISGLGEVGSTSYGINVNNSSNRSEGAANLEITGGALINLPAGAIRLYGARNCQVSDINIISPDAPIIAPISMGPIGAGPNQRCTGNVIKGLRFNYSPASPAPCVFEDPTYAAFVGSDLNIVKSNEIIGNGKAVEFQPNVNSASTVPSPVAGAAVAGAITLNGEQGIVTSEALTTAAAASYTLTFTNSVVISTSNVLVTVGNGTNTGGAAIVKSVIAGAGSVAIVILNNGSSAFNGTLKIHFQIINNL